MDKALLCTKELKMAFTAGVSYPVLDEDERYTVVKDDKGNSHFISKEFATEHFA